MKKFSGTFTLCMTMNSERAGFRRKGDRRRSTHFLKLKEHSRCGNKRCNLQRVSRGPDAAHRGRRVARVFNAITLTSISVMQILCSDLAHKVRKGDETKRSKKRPVHRDVKGTPGDRGTSN